LRHPKFIDIEFEVIRELAGLDNVIIEVLTPDPLIFELVRMKAVNGNHHFRHHSVNQLFHIFKL
jgi:hypothetical protein